MSDLRGQNVPRKVRLGATGRIFGAIIVGLGLCAVGAYTYETGVWTPHHHNQVVASNQSSSTSTPQ